MYILIYTILHRGLEHPWISVSTLVVVMGCPGNNPSQIPRDKLSFGGVKFIHGFLTMHC